MLNCEDSGFYCPQRPMVLVIRELGWLDTHHKPHLLGGSSNLFRSCLFSSTTLSLNCMCSQSLGRDVGSQDLGIPLSGSFSSEIPIFLSSGMSCPGSVFRYYDFPPACPTYHFAYQVSSSKNRELSLQNSPLVSVDFPSKFYFLSFSSCRQVAVFCIMSRFYSCYLWRAHSHRILLSHY